MDLINSCIIHDSLPFQRPKDETKKEDLEFPSRVTGTHGELTRWQVPRITSVTPHSDPVKASWGKESEGVTMSQCPPFATTVQPTQFMCAPQAHLRPPETSRSLSPTSNLCFLHVSLTQFVTSGEAKETQRSGKHITPIIFSGILVQRIEERGEVVTQMSLYCLC